MDLGVELGEDFVARVERQIASCAVLLVVIGPDWASVTDDRGVRRLDDPRGSRAARDPGRAGPRRRRDPAVRSRRADAQGARDACVARPAQALQRPLRCATNAGTPTCRMSSGRSTRSWPRSRRALCRRPQPLRRRHPPFMAGGSSRRAGCRARSDARRPGAVGDEDPAGGLARRRRGGAGDAVVALFLLPGDEPRRVRIGALYSLSGPNAQAGKSRSTASSSPSTTSTRTAIRTSACRLHPGEGLPGLGGIKLDVRERDVKGDACNVPASFDELVDDEGVAAVVGAYESTITQQAVVAANRRQIPLVNDTATAYGADPPGRQSFALADRLRRAAAADPTPSKWFARVGGNDNQFAALFRDFIESQKRDGVPVRKVAVLFEARDSYGSSGAATRRPGTVARRPEELRSARKLSLHGGALGVPGSRARQADPRSGRELRSFRPTSCSRSGTSTTP